ncbi:MAG: PIN domain nuclease, partial [Bacteroidota bacterium]
MNIIVDTSVWSLALRRQIIADHHEVKLLQAFLEETDKKIWLLGIVMLELLQGVPRISQYNKLKESLLRFPFLEPTRDDYIFASEIVNHCSSKGIRVTTI